MKQEKLKFTCTEFSGQKYTGAGTQKPFQFVCHVFPDTFLFAQVSGMKIM